MAFVKFWKGNEKNKKTLDTHARQNEDALLRLQKMKSQKNFKFDHTAYLTYEEQCNLLNDMTTQSENALNWEVGQTAEGRTILAMTINSMDEDKPMIWLDANMRGCDWITSATALYIIDQILTGDSTDAVYLRETFRLIIIPNANPDGYEYSRIERLWIKNRNPNTGSENDTCIGVNLNRNWDIKFNDYGSSENPCSDDFRGVSAMSELETQTMLEMLTQVRPDLEIFISMHAFSQKWLLPFGSSNEQPPDYDELMRVANLSTNQMDFVNHYDMSRKFEIGTVFSFYGLVSGASFDWVKQQYNIPYTYLLRLRPLTAGDGGIDLPPDQIVKSGQEILAGLAECGRQARMVPIS